MRLQQVLRVLALFGMVLVLTILAHQFSVNEPPVSEGWLGRPTVDLHPTLPNVLVGKVPPSVAKVALSRNLLSSAPTEVAVSVEPAMGIAVEHDPTRLSPPSHRDWCSQMKQAHRVVPGQSWGTLSGSDQQWDGQIGEWRLRRCDRFFCRPDALEARGTYRCVPA